MFTVDEMLNWSDKFSDDELECLEMIELSDTEFDLWDYIEKLEEDD